MKVLVDTSVWSLAFLRSETALDEGQSAIIERLKNLIYDDRVVMIGPIRQELLSGIKNGDVYERLRSRLRSFEDTRIEIEDYENAAVCCNRCRAKGVTGSTVDFLICAVAKRRGYLVFTTDNDFSRYSEVLGLKLY